MSFTSGGITSATRGSSAFRLFTMSRVDAPPFFSTDSSTPRAPSWRTMFVCGEKPSRTCATSRSQVVALPAVRTGRSPRPAMASGEPFMRTVYSVAPNFAVPEGRIRFCTLMAFTTSAGDSPRACSAAMSRSTEMSRFLPP